MLDVRLIFLPFFFTYYFWLPSPPHKLLHAASSPISTFYPDIGSSQECRKNDDHNYFLCCNQQTVFECFAHLDFWKLTLFRFVCESRYRWEPGESSWEIKFCLSSKAPTKFNLSGTNNPLKLMFGDRVSLKQTQKAIEFEICTRFNAL